MCVPKSSGLICAAQGQCGKLAEGEERYMCKYLRSSRMMRHVHAQCGYREQGARKVRVHSSRRSSVGVEVSCPRPVWVKPTKKSEGRKVHVHTISEWRDILSWSVKTEMRGKLCRCTCTYESLKIDTWLLTPAQSTAKGITGR